MALPKKGLMTQFTFPMVDKTDFASIESGVTASAMTAAGTRKWFGVTHGGSAATTSGAISKVLSLVTSGVWRCTAKTAETNYDRVEYRFTHPSCADQHIIIDFADNDDSDIMSALTVIQSMASDAASHAAQANSRVLLNQSRISDLQSMVSDLLSDFQSRVPKRVATDSQLSDLTSDLRSFLVVMSGVQSNVYSALTAGVPLNASDMSDLRSAIAAGPAATITASDISDIASAVRAQLVSDLSDLLSRTTQINSRVLLVNSQTSDLYSLLSDLNSDFDSKVTGEVATASQLASVFWADAAASDLISKVGVIKSQASDIQSFLSDMNSDLRSLIGTTGVQLNTSMLSDIRSAIAAGPAATVTASDISDIASAVLTVLASNLSDILSAAQQTNSRALLVQSRISDAQSMLSDFYSDFQSRVPKRVATDSQLSNLASDVKSAALLAQSLASDAHSAAAQANSRVLLVLSLASGIDSALTSQYSDLSSKIGAVSVTIGASDISDIVSGVVAALGFDPSDIASAVNVELGSRLSDILSAAQQTNSRALVIQSHASDIYSLLSNTYSDITSQLTAIHSDLGSQIAATGITASGISDIISALEVAVASRLSDILSAAQQTNSRVLLNQSTASDIYSLLSDLHSDVTAGLSAAQSDLDNLQTRTLTTTAIGKLEKAALRLVEGTVTSAGFTPTSVEFECTDITEATADHYNGCTLVWCTGALTDQRTEVTDYALVGGRGHFTVTAMTEAPAHGDTFILE